MAGQDLSSDPPCCSAPPAPSQFQLHPDRPLQVCVPSQQIRSHCQLTPPGASPRWPPAGITRLLQRVLMVTF